MYEGNCLWYLGSSRKNWKKSRLFLIIRDAIKIDLNDWSLEKKSKKISFLGVYPPPLTTLKKVVMGRFWGDFWGHPPPITTLKKNIGPKIPKRIFF